MSAAARFTFWAGMCASLKSRGIFKFAAAFARTANLRNFEKTQTDRKCLIVGLALALSACATVKAPLATVSAPISGTVNIGGGMKLVPVVKTITIPCEPPTQWLTPYPALAPIKVARMTESQILDQWASDMAAYADLRAEHNALAKWVLSECQPK